MDVIATLASYSCCTKRDQKQQQKYQIAPPNNRIAKQIDAICTSREKLTLDINKKEIKLNEFGKDLRFVRFSFLIVVVNDKKTAYAKVDWPLPRSRCNFAFFWFESSITLKHDSMWLKKSGHKSWRIHTKTHIWHWNNMNRLNWFCVSMQVIKFSFKETINSSKSIKTSIAKCHISIAKILTSRIRFIHTHQMCLSSMVLELWVDLNGMLLQHWICMQLENSWWYLKSWNVCQMLSNPRLQYRFKVFSKPSSYALVQAISVITSFFAWNVRKRTHAGSLRIKRAAESKSHHIQFNYHYGLLLTLIEFVILHIPICIWITYIWIAWNFLLLKAPFR